MMVKKNILVLVVFGISIIAADKKLSKKNPFKIIYNCPRVSTGKKIKKPKQSKKFKKPKELYFDSDSDSDKKLKEGYEFFLKKQKNYKQTLKNLQNMISDHSKKELLNSDKVQKDNGETQTEESTNDYILDIIEELLNNPLFKDFFESLKDKLCLINENKNYYNKKKQFEALVKETVGLLNEEIHRLDQKHKFKYPVKYNFVWTLLKFHLNKLVKKKPLTLFELNKIKFNT
jgi:hypothetical protein